MDYVPFSYFILEMKDINFTVVDERVVTCIDKFRFLICTVKNSKSSRINIWLRDFSFFFAFDS